MRIVALITFHFLESRMDMLAAADAEVAHLAVAGRRARKQVVAVRAVWVVTFRALALYGPTPVPPISPVGVTAGAQRALRGKEESVES